MILWDWAGRAWARPGVSAACLALQDDHGQCAPLLMWSLWLSETGRVADYNATARAVALCREADAAVLGPLRDARRRTVSPEREGLLRQELAAEHDLLDRLELVASSAGFARNDQLVELSTCWGRPLDRAVFEPLIAALRALEPGHVG